MGIRIRNQPVFGRYFTIFYPTGYCQTKTIRSELQPFIDLKRLGEVKGDNFLGKIPFLKLYISQNSKVSFVVIFMICLL